MTAIDTHAAGAETSVASSGTHVASVVDWLTTTDHKRIGRMFIGVSLVASLGAIVVAVLLGIERIDAQAAMLDVNSIPQLFSVYRVGLTFVVLLPLLLGIAIAVVPLQLGARSLALPRLAAAGFWTWFVGSVLVVISIAANGGPGGGDTKFVGLYLVSQIVLLLGLVAGAGAAGHDGAHHPCPGHEHAPRAAVQLVGPDRRPRPAAGACRRSSAP